MLTDKQRARPSGDLRRRSGHYTLHITHYTLPAPLAAVSRLRAPAPVHHHAGEAAEDHVGVLVEVQHGDGAELARGAARGRGVRGGDLRQVGVRVLLQGHVAALPGAVVRVVLLRGHDEVPAELLEVHRQLVPAAEVLQAELVAVERRPPHPALGLQRGDLDVGHLEPERRYKFTPPTDLHS